MKSLRLSEKAMLASFEVSVWSAKCKDQRVTQEVAEKYQADVNMGSYTKKLAPKEALAALRTLRGEMKKFHKENTLPWDDRFNRVLLASNFDSYSKTQRAFRVQFDDLIEQFVAGYPDMIREAKDRLNGLFNSEDYPDPAEIRGFFGIKLEISPFPEKADFRVQLQEDELAEELSRLKDEFAGRMESAVHNSMRDAWNRLHEQVGRMFERLSALDEPIRWDYVSDLKALLDILPRLNLTDDPNLTAMVEAARERLTGHSTEELKEDKETRKKTAKAAGKIMAAMAGYMGV